MKNHIIKAFFKIIAFLKKDIVFYISYFIEVILLISSYFYISIYNSNNLIIGILLIAGIILFIIPILISSISKKEIKEIILILLSFIVIYFLFDLSDFSAIITFISTMIIDIIINERYDIIQKKIQAKTDMEGYKINSSYLELYFNYKKAIIKIFLFIFSLLIIILNSIIKSKELKLVFIDTILLIVISFGISAILSVLIIKFTLKNNQITALISERINKREYPDVDEEIRQFLGDYTNDEIRILTGKFPYLESIKQVRYRIYDLINQNQFDKSNTPNAIKELDNILTNDKSYETKNKDSFDKIIKQLEKIKKEREKINEESKVIICLNKCIDLLNNLSNEGNSNDSFDKIIDQLNKIKTKREETDNYSTDIDYLNNCINHLNQYKNHKKGE